ncbi:zinc finger protein RFP-like [Eublepharis macularius]|uniref:Zinc finger protein RFP-like n=1 Tax=Eublepharis macularius TaxID=481883 RepID=A0AA97J6C6_EUBMA|nr:zinc finger protein RFP-like [Eublepharis macularius]
MAAGNPIKELCDEAICSICLEYFKDPITVNCGHNFCQTCFIQCWEESITGTSCPHCRETIQPGNFKPNRQLANFVELAKKLQEEKRAEGKWGVCERHQEPLKLFCKDDQAFICVVCDRSMEHRNHSAIPMEEAFLLYKKEIQAQLKFLEQERENLKEQKVADEQRSQAFLMQLQTEKNKTKSVFQQMHKYLEKEERLRLSQLEQMEGEMEKRDKENLARFSEEISHLSHLITEMERKVQQPKDRFLQDPKTLSSRYEKKPERQLVKLPWMLEEALRIYSQKTPVLGKALKECEVRLQQTLDKVLRKVNVTLDRNTAHPQLIVSWDMKSVICGDRSVNYLLDNLERFDSLKSVLGREKFTSGRHWWEVEVGDAHGKWAVGVAKESVKRKGKIRLNSDTGFWVMKNPWSNTSYSSYQQSYRVPTVQIPPRKIRVLLDYEEGCVEFFDATNQRISAFSSASFSGQIIRPYFLIVYGNKLKC